MNKKKLILAVFISFMLTSCMPISCFYQMCKTTPESNITLKDNLLVYEDGNCKILYNLWDDGGNVGFQFYNKTETNIYLNLEECFFVSNGISNNYFRNRVYTISTKKRSGQSAANSMKEINSLEFNQTNSALTNSLNTHGTSISSNEEKIICIPALTSKAIKEYCINQTPFKDSDLLRYPNKKQIKTLTFTKTNSPMIYSNRIEYKVGQIGTAIKIENKFYVSEITNYPQYELMGSKSNNTTGEFGREYSFKQYFKKVSPDEFYIKYTREGAYKH